MTLPESKPSAGFPPRHGRLLRRVAWILLLALLATALGVYLVQRFHDPGSDMTAAAPAPAAGATPAEAASQQLRTGAYLARAANCMACHTARGGAAFAGGRVIETPFGQLVSPNITPDHTHGLGAWSADEFWRALHNGKSRDGSFLYPAFPYTSYTRMTRADSDALFAWLRTVKPVAQPNAPHALRFPYNQRFLLAAWRALYFRPGVWQDQPQRSAQWNRGAYLVEGVGHCSACHAARNVLGATQSGRQLGGGLIEALGWYAPSLSSRQEAGVADWARRDVVDLLHTGVSQRSAVFGPMAEVVGQSLQYLRVDDIDAMAVYLKDLPQEGRERAEEKVAAAPIGPAPPADGKPDAPGGQRPAPLREGPPISASADKTPASPAEKQAAATATDPLLLRGGELYRTHCIDCHGRDGLGAPPAYPPLAGNQALLMANAVNPIRMVLNGGFAPATAGNPRPYGMPPFGPVLDDAQVAAVVSYLRASWGNAASAVSSEEVARYRAVPVD